MKQQVKKKDLIAQRAQDFAMSQPALLAVLAMCIFGGFAFGPTFLSYENNLSNVLRQASLMGIAAIGVNFLFLIGARDLSIGATTALCGMIVAKLSPYGFWISILAALAVGAAIGIMNGLIITKLKVQPFIATLGTQLGIRGLALLMNNELSLPLADEAEVLRFIGRGYVFGEFLPMPAAIFIALILISIFITRNTSFGRSLYAIGGSEEAAAMMGVRVDRSKTLAFMISGIAGAIAGIIVTGRLAAAQPGAGTGWEMTIMAAIVIGGTRVRGGVGKIEGVFFGVMFVGLISNLINLNGTISAFWQNIITGTILLLAVLLQSHMEQKKEA
ncbi:ABC transporter permease [Oscillospiraceae bacterium MB08-C2-2]|nr:ABC transporter permease [Oscillospiraceae bacterium MB08-C2-2]